MATEGGGGPPWAGLPPGGQEGPGNIPMQLPPSRGVSPVGAFPFTGGYPGFLPGFPPGFHSGFPHGFYPTSPAGVLNSVLSPTPTAATGAAGTGGQLAGSAPKSIKKNFSMPTGPIGVKYKTRLLELARLYKWKLRENATLERICDELKVEFELDVASSAAAARRHIQTLVSEFKDEGGKYQKAQQRTGGTVTSADGPGAEALAREQQLQAEYLTEVDKEGELTRDKKAKLAAKQEQMNAVDEAFTGGLMKLYQDLTGVSNPLQLFLGVISLLITTSVPLRLAAALLPGGGGGRGRCRCCRCGKRRGGESLRRPGRRRGERGG